MQIPGENQLLPVVTRSIPIEPRRTIAHSMDTLIPGLYIWFHNLHLRIGGSQAESTYQDSYDTR